MRYAALLRQELSSRNAIYASKLGLPHATTYGDLPVVVYKSSVGERKHGNFFNASYKAILRNPSWRHRLEKAHTAKRRSLQQGDNGWGELDSSMSSDALLMNVFCCPGVTDSPSVAMKLGLEVGELPECGFRAGIARDGCVDRTEIDMKLGGLLVESKLTETDFQIQTTQLLNSIQLE
jgi:hypothetical protein